MSSPVPVSDIGSNARENIHHAASILGRSADRKRVFDAVYTGKKQVKTTQEIARVTGLSIKRVLDEGRRLSSNQIVEQTRVTGKVAYRKIDFFHHHKREILRLAASKRKRDAYATKSQPRIVGAKVIRVSLSPQRARTKGISIDDVDSFKRTWRVETGDEIPKTLSEREFREGVQKIIGETGKFPDWPGETHDLFTKRLKVDGKRHAAAFAFKGPSTTGKLTPAKMGKNGDQLQRLFESPAVIFFTQYHGEVDPSVSKAMEALAVAKSLMTGQTVRYGVIDGRDSNRLLIAYPHAFGVKPPETPIR